MRSFFLPLGQLLCYNVLDLLPGEDLVKLSVTVAGPAQQHEK